MALGWGLPPLWSPPLGRGTWSPLPAALPRQDLDRVAGGNLTGR